MARRWAKGKKAKAMCQRSGFIYPHNEMVREPGTGLIVHKSESDGRFNRVDHPQNFSPRARAEGLPLSHASSDVVSDYRESFVLMEAGGPWLLENGSPIYGEDN